MRWADGTSQLKVTAGDTGGERQKTASYIGRTWNQG